jgi:hypothetical protein
MAIQKKPVLLFRQVIVSALGTLMGVDTPFSPARLLEVLEAPHEIPSDATPSSDAITRMFYAPHSGQIDPVVVLQDCLNVTVGTLQLQLAGVDNKQFSVVDIS